MILPLSTALALAVLLGLGSPANGRELAIDLPAGAILFEPPAGYCLLEPESHDADRHLFEMQAQILEPSNRLLAYVIDCRALDRWRADPEAGTGDYGLFMLPLSDGAVRRFDGLSRAAFLDEMARLYEGIGSGDISAAIGEATQRVLAELNIGEIRSVGVLDRDDAAIYVGLLGSFDDGGSAYTLAVLMAMTLLDGYPASFNLYTGYVDGQTFDALLAQQKTHMGRLAAMNTDAAAGPTAGGFDWWALLRVAVLGAAGGVALAFVVLWWRRRRGDR